MTYLSSSRNVSVIAGPVTRSASPTGSFIKIKTNKNNVEDNKDKGHSDHRRHNRKVVTLISVQGCLQKSLGPSRKSGPKTPRHIVLTLSSF